MQNWFMLTLVGQDQPGIVARLTRALFVGGCNLGEASMLRLGANFTVMLMVQTQANAADLQALLEPVAKQLHLHLHLDAIDAGLHQSREADVQITVYGADRLGIVADVTGALAEAGLNILDLESEVAGSENEPLYILQIEGEASQGISALESALERLKEQFSQPLDVHIRPLETMIM